MKKDNEFSRFHAHSILPAERLRRVRNALRRAESFVEYELALRDLDRIIESMERSEDEEGA